jgi:hypothetical protein
MADDRIERLWIVNCRRCSKAIGLRDMCVATQRQAESARRGQLMALESALRSPAEL